MHPSHERSRMRLCIELAVHLEAKRPAWTGYELATAVMDDEVWKCLCDLVRPGRKVSEGTRETLVNVLQQSGSSTVLGRGLVFTGQESEII